MSIILVNKISSEAKQIKTETQFVNTLVLKKLAAHQLSCTLQNLKIYYTGVEHQYGENELIRQGQKVQYLIKDQQLQKNQTQNKNIVYPQELQKIIQSSKIIIIKSANQENINRAKQQSLWATTHSNQQRLKYFFHNFPHVLLMFATNRSYEIKGLARMQAEPDKITDKSVWAGVSNIRLGGNFKIKWLRKKPLSLVSVEKTLGSNFKQNIIKSCDGQQFDPITCKKLAYLFEIPVQPYYKSQDKIDEIKKNQSQKKNISPSNMFVFPPFSPIVPSFGGNIMPTMTPQTIYQTKEQDMSEDSVSSNSSSQSTMKKKAKKEKHKKKKSKKHKKSEKKKKRKHSYSSESISQSSDYSDDLKQSKKKKKKIKKSKKQKKRHS